MRTLILPGFSVKNREWVMEIRERFTNRLPVQSVEWKHWTTDAATSCWIEEEAKGICESIDEPVSLLAKSMGTAVGMVLVKMKPDFIHKVILCGIPVRDLHEGDERYYEVLKTFPTDKLLCFQNEEDNHGSFSEAEAFLHAFNPNLTIIKKSRNDHEYPYPDDFLVFMN